MTAPSAGSLLLASQGYGDAAGSPAHPCPAACTSQGPAGPWPRALLERIKMGTSDKDNRPLVLSNDNGQIDVSTSDIYGRWIMRIVVQIGTHGPCPGSQFWCLSVTERGEQSFYHQQGRLGRKSRCEVLHGLHGKRAAGSRGLAPLSAPQKGSFWPHTLQPWPRHGLSPRGHSSFLLPILL